MKKLACNATQWVKSCRFAQVAVMSLAVAAGAALTASASTELIQNGDFEQGTATDQSWGAYATEANINAGGNFKTSLNRGLVRL